MSTISTPPPCYALKKTNRALCLHPVRPGMHTCGVHVSQESSVIEAMSFQIFDPPTVDSLYPQCEVTIDKRRRLPCKKLARHGFHTCVKHTPLEEGIVSRKAAAAAAAAERDALEEQHEAAGLRIVLCDGVSAPQDDEYSLKDTFDVEEIECLQFGAKAVLYGYRAYDKTEKKNVLYVAETPDDAKELAHAIQENNWYGAALFPSETMSESESE